MRKHPNEEILALYAGRDLEWLERLPVSLHVRGCGACRDRVANFNAVCGDLASVREKHADPLGDWDRLSDEMTANIRLGLSMAECVGPVPQELHGRVFDGFLGRPAVLAFGGATLLFLGAFALNMPVEKIWNRLTLRDQSGLVLESTAAGIEMRRDGYRIISVHPFPVPSAVAGRKQSQAVAANLDGSMSAGYVDDETGQVTIINVAGQ